VAVLIVVAVPLLLALRSLLSWLAREASVELRWARGEATRVAHRDAVATLRRLRLAEELPKERLLEIARHLRPLWVEAGETIYQAKDAASDFFIIGSGRVELQIDGRPRQQLGPGEFFGEQALLHEGPREATAVAVESGRLFALDRGAFHATLEHDVEIRDRLKANLAYRHELSQAPLFRHLSATERDLLLEHFVPVSAAPGQVIVREGEPGDRFYVVQSGEVKVIKGGAEIARLGPGEAFGETALLLNVPRTATVRAGPRTELLALGAEDFHDLLLAYCRREGAVERLSHLRMVAHKRSNHEVQHRA
jgi:CRP-like cAMP-binding protein